MPALRERPVQHICSTVNAQEDIVIAVHCCRCGKTGKPDEFYVPVVAWVKTGVADVDLVEDANYVVTESDIDHALCRDCWDEIEEQRR